MNLIFILLVWLFLGFVIGVAFGKFCTVGNGFDARYLSKLDADSDTLANKLTPTVGPSEKAA